MTSMSSTTPMTMSACGKLYVIIDRDPTTGAPVSVTVPSVKPGGCLAASMHVVGSLIRVALRHGADLAEIADQLEDVHCHKQNGDIQCCYAAISQAIRMELDSRVSMP